MRKRNFTLLELVVCFCFLVILGAIACKILFGCQKKNHPITVSEQTVEVTIKLDSDVIAGLTNGLMESFKKEMTARIESEAKAAFIKAKKDIKEERWDNTVHPSGETVKEEEPEKPKPPPTPEGPKPPTAPEVKPEPQPESVEKSTLVEVPAKKIRKWDNSIHH